MIIAVIGGSTCPNKKIEKLAFQTGIEIARRGHILICGGMSGVMEFACKGAKTVPGSITVGILPGKTKQDANPYVDIPIITAMSH
ncbi:MAG: Rossmann fold nucleotide-binding protein, partial [Endomicrobiia bacterium]